MFRASQGVQLHGEMGLPGPVESLEIARLNLGNTV